MTKILFVPEGATSYNAPGVRVIGVEEAKDMIRATFTDEERSCDVALRECAPFVAPGWREFSELTWRGLASGFRVVNGGHIEMWDYDGDIKAGDAGGHNVETHMAVAILADRERQRRQEGQPR